MLKSPGVLLRRLGVRTDNSTLLDQVVDFAVACELPFKLGVDGLDLRGAAVEIYYIQRATTRPINSVDHIRFWAEWIRDNNGRFKQASKLQGVG